MTAHKDYFRRAAAFDLTTANNYVPPGRSLITPEMTFYNAPSRSLSRVSDESLFSEGITGRGMEFRNCSLGVSKHLADTLHDLLLFSTGTDDEFHNEQCVQLERELIAADLPVPDICFRAWSFSYPTSRGYAVIYDGNLIIL